MHVAARERTPPRGGDDVGCAMRQLPRDLVLEPQRGTRRVRLLEVVADDLVQLTLPSRRARTNPPREALVQLRTQLLRERRVRRVADEDVREAENVLAHEDPALLGQDETPPDVGACVGVRELDDGRPPELLAGDRGALNDLALAGIEPVETRGQERVDRRRDPQGAEVRSERPPTFLLAAQVPLLEQHAEQLLDEERIALGRSHDQRRDVVRNVGRLEQVRHELARLVLAERLQPKHRGIDRAAEPGRPLLEQLRSRQAKQHDRYVANPADEVLEQVEQRRLGPVDVLEDEYERVALRRRLEQLAHRPERLLVPRVEAGEAERARDAVANPLRLFARR